MSFIAKAVSGVAKAVGGIISGVSKVFKAVTSSNIGKIALIGAAVYLGGAAFGMWNSPFTSINGVFASGAAQAAAAPSSAASFLTAGTPAAPIATTAAEAITAGVPVATELAQAGGLVSNLAPALAPAAGIVGSGPLGAPLASAVAPAASKGILSQAMNIASGVGEWVQANPIPAILGGSMVANALSPDQIDVLRERARLGDIEAQRQLDTVARNTAVGGVNLGVNVPSTQMPLQRLTGGPAYGPNGLINRAM